jgi:hypothetical protein
VRAIPIHVFTLVIDREPTDEQFDAVFKTAGDDAVPGTEHGQEIVHFNREAPAMADAIASAVRDIESVGLVVLRVLDEDLLTLAEIADRIGQSRESVRRYAIGKRGPGGFPPPVNPGHGGTLFYRWIEVAPWVREHLRLDVPDTDPALVVANLILQARQHRHQVEHMSALTDLLAA